MQRGEVKVAAAAILFGFVGRNVHRFKVGAPVALALSTFLLNHAVDCAIGDERRDLRRRISARVMASMGGFLLGAGLRLGLPLSLSALVDNSLYLGVGGGILLYSYNTPAEAHHRLHGFFRLSGREKRVSDDWDFVAASDSDPRATEQKAVKQAVALLSWCNEHHIEAGRRLVREIQEAYDRHDRSKADELTQQFAPYRFGAGACMRGRLAELEKSGSTHSKCVEAISAGERWLRLYKEAKLCEQRRCADGTMRDPDAMLVALRTRSEVDDFDDLMGCCPGVTTENWKTLAAYFESTRELEGVALMEPLEDELHKLSVTVEVAKTMSFEQLHGLVFQQCVLEQWQPDQIGQLADCFESTRQLEGEALRTQLCIELVGLEIPEMATYVEAFEQFYDLVIEKRIAQSNS